MCMAYAFRRRANLRECCRRPETHFGDALCVVTATVSCHFAKISGSLQFRAQHFVREDGVRMIEPRRRVMDEPGVDAVSETAGQNLFPLVLEVFQLVRGSERLAMRNFASRSSGTMRAVHFRRDEAHVSVIHADFQANAAGGSHEGRSSVEHPRRRALFQVNDQRQRVERTLESARPRNRRRSRRRRFARHRADGLHE